MNASVTTRLEGENMVVAYGEHTVLNGVDFQVPEGELTVILGPNACGKSTTLKALARVNPLKEGEVRLDGTPLPQMKSRAIAKILAMLPQTPEAPSGVTVADVVARGRYPHQSLLRSWSDEDERACVEAMQAANVLELAERPIEALSGGQRKRAFVARAIAQGAQLLLLDEPFAGVDKRSEAMLIQVIEQLRDEGATVLVSTHDLASLRQFADEALLLRGDILMHDTPEKVLAPENLVRAFGMEVDAGASVATGAAAPGTTTNSSAEGKN